MRAICLWRSIFTALAFAGLFVSFPAWAKRPTANADSLIHSASPKDVWDIGKYILGIRSKPGVDKDSLYRALRRPYIIVLPGIGYALQTGFAIACPINISFFIDHGQDANISTITMDGNYTFKHQFFLPVLSNIWTKGNMIDFQGDWRYYKYPTLTYGLGGHTSLYNADAIDYSHIRIYQTALRKVVPDLLIGAGYALDYHWNIRDLNTDPVTSDLVKYHIPTKTVSTGPTFNVLYDSRRNSNNPHPGYYANIIMGANMHALGSDRNWQTMTIDLRKYIHFPVNSSNTLAFWNYSWLTFGGPPPYLDLPSTGWDTYANMGRGYIQGRLRGSKLLYFETEYRFHLMANDLIGGVVFANIQTVPEYGTNKFEVYYPAAGLGLRLKANKRSNVNFSIDYAWGIGNSQGFFFNLGEVF